MLFSTANLVFTPTLFIYDLVISHTDISVFTLRLASGAQSARTTQTIFLLNTMNKKFASNLLSQGSIEQEYLSKNLENQFLRCLIKIEVSVLNFSTESAKLQNQQFITCQYSLQVILLNMTISIWDEKLAPQQLFYYNQSCFRFGTHFSDKPKILI